MDPGVAAILGAAVTAFVTVVLAVLGPFVAAWVARREQTRSALLTFRLRGIDSAERGLILQLLTFEAIADRDVARGRRLVGEAAELAVTDPRLLGDVDALRVLVAAQAPIASRLRWGLVGSTLAWLTGLDVSRLERQALIDAKTAVHQAFEAQRERVIRGREAVLIDIPVSRTILDANPAVQDFMARWAADSGTNAAADLPHVTPRPGPVTLRDRIGRAFRRPHAPRPSDD